jgi:glutathione peroxidase-family protein
MDRFKVLAFPCNQFNNQEPASDEDIKNYLARKHFKATLFKKIQVNGNNTHEVFKWLKAVGLNFFMIFFLFGLCCYFKYILFQPRFGLKRKHH